jgi:glutamate transport system permease protein
LDYRLLAKDLSPRAEARLRVIGLLVAFSCVSAVALVGYGLYRTGELDAARWQIFAHAATWKFLAIGLWNTVRVAIADLVFSMTLGAAVAMAQTSRNDALRLIGGAYAEGFRAIPTLLMILFCFFGLPLLGVGVTPFWAIVIGSGLYNSAALSNIFKSGILTIDRGQSEAAYSLGVARKDVMTGIIWPQALRRMRPSIVAQCVVLFKDSSLGFVIGYEEVLRRSQEIGTFTSSSLQPYVVGGCIYIVVIYLLRRFTGQGSQEIDESAA